nr:MAG TPA: hypothetical protein [Caudoviricetes sp.]
MTCKDCFHYMPCGVPSWGNMTGCPEFTPRNEWVHLPRKPLPLLKDGNPELAEGLL